MIRAAQKADLHRLQEIYTIAKAFMRKTGNMSQWINGYPADALLLNDIEQNHLFVMEEDHQIFAVFALIYGVDHTYLQIDGAWLNDEYYGTIHRIASDGTHHDILKQATLYALEKADNVRIDTHADNSVMQHCILKNGYQYCGIIIIDDGSPRNAYQLAKNTSCKSI